jgi:signal transduction histidine kinase
MTIRARLALGLFAIALVLLAPLVLALRTSTELARGTRDIRESGYDALAAVSRARVELDELRRLETTIPFIRTDTTGYAPVDSIRDRAEAVRVHLGRLHPDAGLTQLAPRVLPELALVERLVEEEERLVRSAADTAAYLLSRDSITPALVRTEAALRAAEIRVADRVSRLVADAGGQEESAQRASLFAFGLASLLAFVITILTWRSIARPIREFETGMAEVAGGNLRYRLPIEPDRDDEFGRLSSSFRSMAEQLEQLDRLKAEFISIASHELKTPINVILGYIQLLEEGVYGPINERQAEILGTLDAQSQSLARLVHQLLDVSRFEAGGGKLEPRPMNLDDFLGELEQTFHVLAVQRAVSFRVYRGEGLPHEVLWDADRMNEVLGNLLSNAFKFTNRGGTVMLRAEPLDGEVHFEVSDTGAGIPPEQLPHIFQKFYQADNQASAAHGGTGLGLAIARQIVVAHGGSIAVDSTVGIGTTFDITMPVRAGARLSEPARPLPAAAPAGASA